MSRTTPALVVEILGSDYGPLPDGSFPNLQPYISASTVIVDRVYLCASKKSITLTGIPVGASNDPVINPSTDTELELIERWLAAHTYTQMDPTYSSRSTGGGSGSFLSVGGDQAFSGSRYGVMAINIDYSGCLKNLYKQQRARGFWLGQCRDS